MLSRAPSLLLLLLLAGCASSHSNTVAEEPPGPEPPSDDSVTAATPTEMASKERCCSQCGKAASKDPSGRDLSMDLCTGYVGFVVNGTPPLDAACAEWFETHPLTVAECG